jgi:hypothetical protein
MGKEGVWFNTKIGRSYDAIEAKHPCNQTIKGFLINGLLFVPEENCNLSNPELYVKSVIVKSKGIARKKSTKTINDYTVSATNAITGEMHVFKNTAEAVRELCLTPNCDNTINRHFKRFNNKTKEIEGFLWKKTYL